MIYKERGAVSGWPERAAQHPGHQAAARAGGLAAIVADTLMPDHPAAAIAGAELGIAEGAGHLLPLERPALLALPDGWPAGIDRTAT